MNRHKRNHRKIAAVCMATCLAAAASEAGMLTASAAPVGSSYKAGDCNKDGGIDVQDVNVLESWLTGTDTQLNEYGDVDGDGRINAKDLTLLKRKLLEPEDETSDKRVMLVYMCGSDLESGYSEATEDLNEMLKAKYTEDLEVVILTGGASKWNNSYAAADGNYYITIGSEGVKSEKMSGGTHKMSDGNTLKTFISEATAAHPADHYSLVFWDHGSGPLFGLCYDEIAENVLSTTAMYQAIGAAGVHFDWIGFDCCLMGSAEVAYTLRDYADYMIGSEEYKQKLLAEHKKYDIIVANILADVIIPLSEVVIPYMHQDSIFISSGIIHTKAEAVREALLKNHYDILEERHMNDWAAFAAVLHQA